jgi:drug/metabolite transporter (DMT)-like permease
MSRTLVLFLGVAAVGSAVYHLAQRSVPAAANPMLALMGAYLVAFAAAAAAAPFFSSGELAWRAQMFSAPVLWLGAGVFLIEIGFLLAYRAGGGVQWSGVAVNTASALLLLPVALVVLREPFSPWRAAGLLLCLGGLWLVTRAP